MITIQYQFTRHADISGLETLNTILKSLPLKDLTLEDSSCYLYTGGNAQLPGHRYGPDRGRLKCILSRNQPGYRFQIDTLLCPVAEDHSSCIQDWKDTHPDRILHYAMVYRFEAQNVDTLLILHRNKTS